ncbi:MAG: hypothetical protein EOM20_12895 [Spartobacteria bacterium]|nr:hypothetical protein [Spartobacteria bacterium]
MFVLDTHVHIYPCYSIEALLSDGIQRMMRLTRHEAGTIYGFCLTERFDCEYFRQWKEHPETFPSQTRHLETTGDTDSLRLCGADLPPVYLFAGHQINTRERIEVLALGLAEKLADRGPIRETIDEIEARGGVPTLCWAPGKWFFERGKTVRHLIDEYTDRLTLADTTLRPSGWPEPRLFSYARQRNVTILAGSDPLPFAGEERYAGSYVTCFENETFDHNTPAQSMRNILRSANQPRLAGTRTTPPTMLLRLYKNAKLR